MIHKFGVALLKQIMAFGRLQRVFEKIKSFGKKVWGGIKKVVGVVAKNPLIKGAAQAAATAYGGPAAGAAVGLGFGVGEALADNGVRGAVAAGGDKFPPWLRASISGGGAQ
jgi:hypothetical protein